MKPWVPINFAGSVMKHIQIMLRFLSLICALGLVAACSQQIQGKVFLDQNGNNVGDQGELAISGVPYTVTLNDKTYSTGVTQTGGNYSVILDKMNSDGTYCVKVDSATTLSQKSASLNKPSTPKLLTDDSSSSGVCSMNDQDTPNCNDEDCCDEPECESASVCQQDENDDDETDSNVCPTDANNQPDCDDSRCASRSACNQDKRTVKPMEACGEMAKTSLVMNLDVPISVDYSSRIEKIDPATPITAKLGDLIEVDIIYPSSCTFDLYTLPAVFYPEGLKGFYNEITREFSLDQAVTKNISRLRKIDKTPFGHDPLFIYTLYLRIVQEPETGSAEYVMQPSLICPDGQSVKSSAPTILMGEGADALGNEADADISLLSEISPHCPPAGDSATLLTELTNPTSTPLSQVSVKIPLGEGGDFLSLTDFSDECIQKADALECEIGSMPASAKKTIYMDFQMDDTVPVGSSVKLAPEWSVGETVYADTILTCGY